MTTTRAFAWIGLLALATLVPGCLINSSSTKVVESDAKRNPVSFESDEVLMLFQRTVQERYNNGGGNLGTSAFGVPFVVGASQQKRLSENAFYNAQVEKTDVDGDGLITLAEARAYAQ